MTVPASVQRDRIWARLQSHKRGCSTPKDDRFLSREVAAGDGRASAVPAGQSSASRMSLRRRTRKLEKFKLVENEWRSETLLASKRDFWLKESLLRFFGKARRIRHPNRQRLRK